MGIKKNYGLKWLFKDAEKEDVLLFHFSGRGSWIVARDGGMEG